MVEQTSREELSRGQCVTKCWLAPLRWNTAQTHHCVRAARRLSGWCEICGPSPPCSGGLDARCLRVLFRCRAESGHGRRPLAVVCFQFCCETLRCLQSWISVSAESVYCHRWRCSTTDVKKSRGRDGEDGGKEEESWTDWCREFCGDAVWSCWVRIKC